MNDARDFHYVGNELALFAGAENWKAYWGRKISPYLGNTVLDVGAGLGATAKLLCGPKQKRWLALEPDSQLSAAMCESKRSGHLPATCEIRTGTLADVHEDEKFDTILYVDVLEHIQNHAEELANAEKHLENNGCIIVLSPAHQRLFTPFDSALGHFRRYDKNSIRSATPASLALDRYFYLDCAGLLATLGNKLFLQSASPNPSQIWFWDRVLVPVSRVADPVFRFSLGKSIVAIWRRK